MTTLTTIFLVFVTVLGGAGLTAYAAEDSLPGDVLFPVKLFGEEVHGLLVTSPKAELQLALDRADRRCQEIATLASQGMPVPENMERRLIQQLDLALQAVVGLPDRELAAALAQVRERLQTQKQLLDQVRNRGEVERLLERMRAQIQNRLRLVEEGISDPQTFRHRLRFGQPTPEPSRIPPISSPTPSSGYDPGHQPSATPGNSYGPTPHPSVTPDNGHGPDPQPTPPPGQGHGTGPEPSATPGDGNGHGPLPSDTPHGGNGLNPNPIQQSTSNPGSENNPSDSQPPDKGRNP